MFLLFRPFFFKQLSQMLKQNFTLLKFVKVIFNIHQIRQSKKEEEEEGKNLEDYPTQRLL